MSKPVIAGILFFAVVIGMMIWASLGLAKTKVEVCVEFNNRQNCATASGQSREVALRAATTSACALVASGVGDTIACEHKTPLSTRWIK